MSSNKLPNKILIIGNGFDLDLGLKSSYSHFVSSDKWTNLFVSYPEYREKYCLAKHLYEASQIKNWFDLELELYKYVKEQIDDNKTYGLKFKYAESDKKEFELICSLLKSYLKEESRNFKLNSLSVASTVINSIVESKMFYAIYSFNYTDLGGIIHTSLNVDEETPSIIHVHGSLLENDDIILGVESTDEMMPEEYSYLYKTSSPYYRSNNMYNALQDADEVVFFGHSINGMDFDYFKDFFRIQSDATDMHYRRKRITIFTGDVQSSTQIKYNFRKSGINVIDLFRLNDIEFVHTLDIEEKNKNFEQKKLDNFLKRIKKESEDYYINKRLF